MIKIIVYICQMKWYFFNIPINPVFFPVCHGDGVRMTGEMWTMRYLAVAIVTFICVSVLDVHIQLVTRTDPGA